MKKSKLQYVFKYYVLLNGLFKIKQLVKCIVIICILCGKTYAFQNTNINNDAIFTIQGGIVFCGLEKDRYEIINRKENIYIASNTKFISNEQLFANVIKVESKYKSLINEFSNQQTKIQIVHQNEEHRVNADLPQIKPIPFNTKHSGFYFFACLDCGIVPSPSNQYHSIVIIEGFLSFYTNQPVLEFKKQSFIYCQFTKAFTINILLFNKPPPVLFC